MPEETAQFLHLLLARCDPFVRSAALTFTAMHPARDQPSPSRHIRLDDAAIRRQSVHALLHANQHGWGAYVAVGLRRSGLSRWKRGGIADVVTLPALFADVDDPSPTALTRLMAFHPAPSCIVSSGGGYHAYWWLEEPTVDLNTARRILRGLADILGGDRLSVAQSLRLPGSMNTKLERGNARCGIITLHEQRHALECFTALLPAVIPLQPCVSTEAFVHTHPEWTYPFANGDISDDSPLNPQLIRAASLAFARRGYRRAGNWLCGQCLTPARHRHSDQHPSFGFNTRTGYGYCYVCGVFLLKDLCRLLHIRPAAYGGLLKPEGTHDEERTASAAGHHADLAPQ